MVGASKAGAVVPPGIRTRIIRIEVEQPSARVVPPIAALNRRVPHFLVNNLLRIFDPGSEHPSDVINFFRPYAMQSWRYKSELLINSYI